MRTRAVLVLLFACGAHEAPPKSAALGNGVVAVAGSVAIDATLVADVANKHGESAKDSLDALVFDAVLAQGAQARNLDARPASREATRAIRARFVLDRIARDARARGAPTDQEIQDLTARHWREVDLPEQARAVHVVVMTPHDPKKKSQMRAVAEDMRRAVLGATDAADFIARAKRVDAEGLEVKPETLPLFVADGRVVKSNSNLDTKFATTAFALAPGETSPIVETQFGLHVIRMLERLPAKRLSLEERRVRFADEAVAVRGHDAYTALIADLRQTHSVSVDPAANALMANATVNEEW